MMKIFLLALCFSISPTLCCKQSKHLIRLYKRTNLEKEAADIADKIDINSSIIDVRKKQEKNKKRLKKNCAIIMTVMCRSEKEVISCAKKRN